MGVCDDWEEQRLFRSILLVPWAAYDQIGPVHRIFSEHQRGKIGFHANAKIFEIFI